MSLKQKAIKGVVWSAIQNWGSQTGSLIVFFVLARLLEPKDFGLVALANVFLAFMQIFLEQGFAQAIIQRDELDPEHLDTAFWSNVAIGLLLAGSGFIAADWVAILFKEPQLTPILRCLSLVFLINAFRGTQQAILERQFAFKELALRSILGIVMGGLVGIGMAIAGLGVWSLVGQQLTNELVGTLVLWNVSHWSPGLKVSIQHFKQLFKFGINILALNFIGFFNTRVNDFLIGYFLGTAALGYYAISYRILQVLTQLLVRTTNAVSLPTFSRLKNDLDRFRDAFYTVTRLTSAIAFPVFIGVAVLAPQLVEVFFGQKWLPSVPLLQILSVVGMVRSISLFKSSVLIAAGEPGWTVILKLLSVTANLLGFAIAYHWGIIAITLAYMIQSLLLFPVGQWIISRIVSIPLGVYLRQFLMPLTSSLVMGGIILVLKHYLSTFINAQIVILIICTFLGLLTYLASLRIVSPSVFKELKFFYQTAITSKGFSKERRNAEIS